MDTADSDQPDAVQLDPQPVQHNNLYDV